MTTMKSARKTPATVTVDYRLLRQVLDYLHDNEADHYDPEEYPEDAETHVYSFVLAIEAQLRAQNVADARDEEVQP